MDKDTDHIAVRFNDLWDAYPNICGQHRCFVRSPVCYGTKSRGMFMCWPCHTNLGTVPGKNLRERLDFEEAKLALHRRFGTNLIVHDTTVVED